MTYETRQRIVDRIEREREKTIKCIPGHVSALETKESLIHNLKVTEFNFLVMNCADTLCIATSLQEIQYFS
jgi:hypothetical protein